MTTTTHPDLPVPAGAYVLSDWDESENNEYRIISTEHKEVEGTNVGICVDAPQPLTVHSSDARSSIP